MASAATATMLSQEVGESIPPNTAHVSKAILENGRANADRVGCFRFATYVENQYWLRGGRKLGAQ